MHIKTSHTLTIQQESIFLREAASPFKLELSIVSAGEGFPLTNSCPFLRVSTRGLTLLYIDSFLKFFGIKEPGAYRVTVENPSFECIDGLANVRNRVTPHWAW